MIDPMAIVLFIISLFIGSYDEVSKIYELFRRHRLYDVSTYLHPLCERLVIHILIIGL